MDQATEEKANKNTQTPSGTKRYSLKSGAVVCYSITADYRQLFLDARRNGNILKRRSSAERPARIKKDKKGKGTKLSV